jgi:hypothetical protein
MSVCAKFYNRILLACIRDGLDKYLRPNQNGFHPLRSIRQHVLTWKRIHEEVCSIKDSRLTTGIILILLIGTILIIFFFYMMFLIKFLTQICPFIMELKLLLNIMVLLQGKTHAPYLFIIVLDWVIRIVIQYLIHHLVLL